jgi:uncharacterized protein YkwD
MSKNLLQPSPSHPLRRAMALAGGSLLSAALLAWTPAIVAAWNQSSAESTLWQLMNGDRVNNGVRPILQNGTLVSLARWRSKDMIQRDYFSHTVLGTNYMVFHWYDTSGLSYSWGGENIGWNSGYADGDSPVAINNAFMASADHRSNILNPDWTHGGIGAYAADNVSFLGKTRSPRMYTELFMQAKSAAPKPTPRPQPKPTPRPTPRPQPKPTPKPAPKAPKPAPTAKPSPSEAPLDVPSGAQAALTDAHAGSGWLASDPFESQSLDGAAVVTGYRIDAPAPADRGFFETVLGTLLGFVL